MQPLSTHLSFAHRVLLLTITWLIAACATSSAETRTPVFEAWLTELRRDALGQEISDETLNVALARVKPNPRIIELDRSQPEFTLSFDDYLQRVVSNRRVRMGRQRLAKYRGMLRSISQQYGVQPRFLVALWGIETNFGRTTGAYPVVESLVTLAYDGRRSQFFREELLIALHIVDQGHVQPGKMKGSWAGAMGQVQFMPSTFQRYAVDYDGDGLRDIWGSKADALASAANYLSAAGWHYDQTWGRRVRLPKNFDPQLVGTDIAKDLSEWQRLGVRRADGRDLPSRDLPASVIQPGDSDGPAYIVYDNYRTLLEWNRSDYFATAVGTLADRIGFP